MMNDIPWKACCWCGMMADPDNFQEDHDEDVCSEKNPFSLETVVLSNIQHALIHQDCAVLERCNIPATVNEVPSSVYVNPDTMELSQLKSGQKVLVNHQLIAFCWPHDKIPIFSIGISLKTLGAILTDCSSQKRLVLVYNMKSAKVCTLLVSCKKRNGEKPVCLKAADIKPSLSLDRYICTSKPVKSMQGHYVDIESALLENGSVFSKSSVFPQIQDQTLAFRRIVYEMTDASVISCVRTGSWEKLLLSQVQHPCTFWGYSAQVEILHELLRATFSSHSNDLKNTGGIIHGPSGCGKSLLVDFLGSHYAVKIILLRPIDIWCENSEQTIERIEKEIFMQTQCIMHLQDLHVLCPKKENCNSDAEKHHVSLVESLIDKIVTSNKTKVVVFGTTDSLFHVNSHIRESGKLHHDIELTVADSTSRVQITEAMLQQISGGFTSEGLETWTRGFTGCDVLGLCKEALAVRLAKHTD